MTTLIRTMRVKRHWAYLDTASPFYSCPDKIYRGKRERFSNTITLLEWFAFYIVLDPSIAGRGTTWPLYA